MPHDMLLLYGAEMHTTCPPRFRRICVLTAVTCATTCLPAALLVACGAEHRAPEAPAQPRGTSATPGPAPSSPAPQQWSADREPTLRDVPDRPLWTPEMHAAART